MQVLQFNQNNVNITFENYLNTVNTLINSHAPLKKLNKKQRKFQQKPRITPWITKGIQNATETKNSYLKSILDVMIVIKIFFIKNIKHIETIYQLY